MVERLERFPFDTARWEQAEIEPPCAQTIQDIAIDKVKYQSFGRNRSFRVNRVEKIHTFASGCLCSSDRTSQSCSTLIEDSGGTSKSANGLPPSTA